MDLVLDGLTGLRAGTDPIHDTRVAIRRTRSTLRVFKKHLDPVAGPAFEEELKWFAGVLGDVRDVQVQRQRLRDALDAIPELLVLGPVKSRIDRDLRGIEAPARDRVSEAMETTRYLNLVTELQRWSAAAPVLPTGTSKRLSATAQKAGAKADRRLKSALKSDDDELLHRARKAAKRARYANELLQLDRSSTRARRNIKHYKQIQSVLGDVQDTVVARTMLRQLGAAAGTTPGENGFTFGLLYAREEQLARQCRRDVAAL
ncbi:CHAD domain-containing protein [Mycolicibacterium sp. BiH015]|nr:CHAD domain-containing protein [Mycolicibacterium sp. BiH015]MDA2891967.1 CHAD domain-containing protein [Mycolicibacterium sp. BiH015]